MIDALSPISKELWGWLETLFPTQYVYFFFNAHLSTSVYFFSLLFNLIHVVVGREGD